jgi:RNA polymerase sigma-70 factor (ECF subfamily)
MSTTSISLLERVRAQSDQAWSRFVELYTPLLFYWARRVCPTETDAADLVQEVFLVLVKKLPEFEYDPARSFRSWLRTITINKWRERCRRQKLPMSPAGEAALVEVPEPPGDDSFEESEYRRQLVGRALEIMSSEFEPATWKACWEHVVGGRPAAEIAAELHLTPNAVYIAKCRVLRRLRQELNGLLD